MSMEREYLVITIVQWFYLVENRVFVGRHQDKRELIGQQHFAKRRTYCLTLTHYLRKYVQFAAVCCVLTM